MFNKCINEFVRGQRCADQHMVELLSETMRS